QPLSVHYLRRPLQLDCPFDSDPRRLDRRQVHPARLVARASRPCCVTNSQASLNQPPPTGGTPVPPPPTGGTPVPRVTLPEERGARYRRVPSSSDPALPALAVESPRTCPT